MFIVFLFSSLKKLNWLILLKILCFFFTLVSRTFRKLDFLQCSQCCFCTAYTPHMDCIRTANGGCVKQVHLTYSSWNQACAVCKLLCNNCTIVKTKMQCMIKRLGEINIYFWKMSKKCPPSPFKLKNPLSQELPKRGIHFQKWNSGPE